MNHKIKLSNNVKYIKFATNNANGMIQFSNIQLEEGDIATSYEPYKETNATIYLNSPLLQGDKIEVVDGKLCHYHKMGKVVLDGDEYWVEYSNKDTSMNFRIATITNIAFCNGSSEIANIISNNFNARSLNHIADYNIEGVAVGTTSKITISIDKTKLSTTDVNGFKQWLSENPTTLIYELAEPYYEDITPLQSSFVISTVSEGDMEIITDLPIKSNITYLTNITSAVLMEQQLDELDNGTESLTNIVEDKINE
jgi:hypothetical protein